MRSLVGYTRTGRIQKGPGSDLVDMFGPDGSQHTAIEFHPEYRSHNAINAALGVVLSFLESPLVSGLTDLGAYDLSASTFLYPTGQTWSVAEVVRTLSDLGEVGGVRAGVELMATVGQVLVEAAETGESAGVYSHGGLTPWRVVLDAEGQAQVIGHALPQVEILTFHEEPDRVPREDAFRYCPPERMEARRENFSSDLFGLALIAFEVMCGKPVYDGLVNDIRAKAARGESSRRIHQFREFLPESVRALLTTTMRPDFGDRYGSGSEYFDAVNASLRDPAVVGVGLRDMMQRVIRQQPRARQELDPAKTSMLSKDELKKMMDVEEPAPKARAGFVPPRARAEPLAPPAAPLTVSAPSVSEAAAAPLSASSSRVGLPPARRPPPRTGQTAEELPPVVAPRPAVPAPPESVVPARAEPPRPGARPNPRLSQGGDASAAPAAPAAPAVVDDRGDRPESPRLAVGVARLPPARRPSVRPEDPGGYQPEPVPEPAAEAPRPPVDPGRPVPPAPNVSASGDRAKDLLARVRASGSEATHRPTPSAAAVLDRILTSSGSGGALRDRVARAVEDAGERADDAASRPSAPSAASGPAPPVLPPALPRADPPGPPSIPSARPAAAEPPVEREVERRVPEASQAPAPPVATPTVASPARPEAAAVVASPSPSPSPPPPPSPSPASASATSSRTRVPDALKSNLKGDPLPYKLSRGNGTPLQRRRVPAASTLADIVGLLVGQVVPLRTTPDGRVVGWWRLGPAAGPLPPDTRLEALDPEVPLVFHVVEGRIVVLDVEIHTGTLVRLRMPVSTVLPAQTLVDAFATLLDLPAGDWVVALDGVALEPFYILEDLGVKPGAVLALRRL